MAQANKVVAVTRYTDHDAEFTFLGVFSNGKTAHQEISKNIELFGKYSFRKDDGHWDYTMVVKPDSVELNTPKGRTSVRYKLTETVVDELIHVSEF